METPRHPLYEIADCVFENTDAIINDIRYTEKHHVSVRQWRKNITKKDVDTNNLETVPGVFEIREHIAKFNNTHLPVSTVAEFKKRNKRLQAFERYLIKGWKKTYEQMVKDNLAARVLQKPNGYIEKINSRQQNSTMKSITDINQSIESELDITLSTESIIDIENPLQSE